MDTIGKLGKLGEDAATARLVALGWQILDRNWRCREGELDIVARDGAAVVFCEVKTRSGTRFGPPAGAVDRRKAARIRRLAVRWLQDRRGTAGWRPPALIRFDVLGVTLVGGVPRVEHLRGAF